MNDWESQGSRVQELNKSGSELESIIIEITAPKTKTGKTWVRKSGDGNRAKENKSPTLLLFK